MSGQVTLFGQTYTISYLTDPNIENLLPPSEVPGGPPDQYNVSVDTSGGATNAIIRASDGNRYNMTTLSDTNSIDAAMGFGNYVFQDIIVNRGSKTLDAIYYYADLDLQNIFSLFTVKDDTPLP